jgi:hypothetical protein
MCLAASAAAALLSVAAVVDVAVDAGVERDHGDVAAARLLQQRRRGARVERREPEDVGLAAERVLQHVHLGLDLGLAGRAFEADPHALRGRFLLRALLDGLPELVLEALGDDGEVRLVAAAPAGVGRAAARRGRQGEGGRREGRSDPVDPHVDRAPLVERGGET